ncbi:flavin reductase family protein [Microvirga flavescens]|uniref:flavin reductase family protein n=1 Tax=Microvirga flavescens TaxID=2249811 RepID=UPI000DD966FA|nr:flavin reductase family protein [Microvirga flavescens]
MILKAPPLDSAARSELDPMLFREGMSRVAAAVHVVTTDGPAGRAGFTATAVTPVTDTPASLLVCVNSSGRSVKSLLQNGVFCVNTLSADDVAVADTFAGRKGLIGPDRFSVGIWDRSEAGLPRLTTGLVAFDCRISEARRVATHHVIIGEILAVALGDRRAPLIYQGRAYHRL